MSDALPRGLEGAWIPIAASVSGKELLVAELRVKYLVFDGHDYNIIDRSRHAMINRCSALLTSERLPYCPSRKPVRPVTVGTGYFWHVGQ
jgi:hypothetical protein